MMDVLIYTERVTSNRTEVLFLVLTFLPFALFLRRVKVRIWDRAAVAFLLLSGLFSFYSLNFRTLTLRLTARSLTLTFGVLTWRVSLDNVQECRLDEVPLIQRYGGAGVHFMIVRGRYRASFNFLEHPRVVVSFKKPVGPVRDISFSTRRPGEVVRLVNQAASARHAVMPEFQ